MYCRLSNGIEFGNKRIWGSQKVIDSSDLAEATPVLIMLFTKKD